MYDKAIPEWIDNCFPNLSDNFVVYTKDPMKKFFMKEIDVIVRCTIGSVVFFTIVSQEWFQNWWVCDSVEVAPNKFSFEINREISKCETLKKAKQSKKPYSPGWVKITDCSSRGPEYNSQQPHGGSQPSVMGS